MLLFWFGNGLYPWWPLMWFAPLPVLLFASRSSWWGAALVAVSASLLGNLNLWWYFTEVLHAPPIVWVLVFSVAAAIYTAAVLLFRALLLRGAPWSALLAFPATWVAYEYVRNLTTPHGTAGIFAYSQMHFLPFLQLASVTGPWGLSFLLMLFPCALVIGLHLRQRAPKQALRVVGASLGVITLVLIFGVVRLALPSHHEQVKVGLIASDTSAGVADAGVETEQLFHKYASAAKSLAASGAQVIVLPENLGVVVGSNIKGIDSIFQSLADDAQATIVVGMLHVSPPLKYNEARVYAPKTSVLSYDKHHLLPPFESPITPGTTLTLVPKASTNWGVAICKDMDFTPLSRQYGEAGVGLMLVPGWDFQVDRSWHGHMAIMRGVESGFSIAHSARGGYLTVTDDRGRILAEARSNSAPFASLATGVPVVHHKTLYLMLGDWFAWLAIATLPFTLLRLCLIPSN